MGGDLEDMVTACRTFFQAEQLKKETGQGGPAAPRPSTPDDD